MNEIVGCGYGIMDEAWIDNEKPGRLRFLLSSDEHVLGNTNVCSICGLHVYSSAQEFFFGLSQVSSFQR